MVLDESMLLRLAAADRLVDNAARLVKLTSATYVSSMAAIMPKLVVDGREQAVDDLMGAFFGSQYDKRTLCFDAILSEQQEAKAVAQESMIVHHGAAVVMTNEGTAVIFGEAVCYMVLLVPFSGNLLYLGGTMAQLTDLLETVSSSLSGDSSPVVH